MTVHSVVQQQLFAPWRDPVENSGTRNGSHASSHLGIPLESVSEAWKKAWQLMDGLAKIHYVIPEHIHLSYAKVVHQGAGPASGLDDLMRSPIYIGRAIDQSGSAQRAVFGYYWCAGDQTESCGKGIGSAYVMHSSGAWRCWFTQWGLLFSSQLLVTWESHSIHHYIAGAPLQRVPWRDQSDGRQRQS